MYTYISICVCVCIHVYVHVYVYICMYRNYTYLYLHDVYVDTYFIGKWLKHTNVFGKILENYRNIFSSSKFWTMDGTVKGTSCQTSISFYHTFTFVRKHLIYISFLSSSLFFLFFFLPFFHSPFLPPPPPPSSTCTHTFSLTLVSILITILLHYPESIKYN